MIVIADHRPSEPPAYLYSLTETTEGWIPMWTSDPSMAMIWSSRTSAAHGVLKRMPFGRRFRLLDVPLDPNASQASLHERTGAARIFCRRRAEQTSTTPAR